MVRAGWDADYVLDLPIDSFGEVLLVVQKQELQAQMNNGLTLMSVIATLFAKKGTKSSLDVMQESMTKIEDALMAGLEGDETMDDYDESVPTKPRRVRRKSADPEEHGRLMVRQFHAQFAAYMSRHGVAVPDINAALNKRAKMLERRMKTNQQAERD